MEAINYARQSKNDVVLVDTAGRMQDNEPLMRSLAKLITVNDPDLVLFVGEALVGNEAVDQLVKFNQALSDYSPSQTNPHLIDGIVLTKFDTIDDKVMRKIYNKICIYQIRPARTLTRNNNLNFSTGWIRNIYDIHNRTTHSLCWNRTNIYRPQISKCKVSSCVTHEIMQDVQYIYVKQFITTSNSIPETMSRYVIFEYFIYRFKL